MQLFGYFRSSASYRVRIALALKGLEYEYTAVNLLKGEQREETYKKLNPQGLVPALKDGEHVLTQSMAIFEYLEETYPEPALLPKDGVGRARVRAIAMAIASEIAPINNLCVLQYLEKNFGQDADGKKIWMHHWMSKGFEAIERMLAHDESTGRFCHGDTPGMADCFLMPQLFNAHRFALDLAPYPTILRIEEACSTHPAFDAAHPAKQPDAA